MPRFAWWVSGFCASSALSTALSGAPSGAAFLAMLALLNGGLAVAAGRHKDAA